MAATEGPEAELPRVVRVDPLFDRVPRQNWSQTKTVVALLTGIAQRLGYVDSSIGRSATWRAKIEPFTWASPGRSARRH
ncbi:MAG TPA: hypothetical protein VHU88_08720 [Sporichthyaceae bacterium]|nr:hypothetical protein [Sporichthyaceae bacterium]